jgi:hypothetical protein
MYSPAYFMMQQYFQQHHPAGAFPVMANNNGNPNM